MKRHTNIQQKTAVPKTRRARAARESDAPEMRQRNREIMMHYYATVRTVAPGETLDHVLRQVVALPVSSAWITPENASKIISEELGGRSARRSASRCRMARWLVARYEEYCLRMAALGCVVSPTLFARDVLPHLRLPESFIEPSTAKRIIYNQLRQC